MDSFLLALCILIEEGKLHGGCIEGNYQSRRCATWPDVTKEMVHDEWARAKPTGYLA